MEDCHRRRHLYPYLDEIIARYLAPPACSRPGHRNDVDGRAHRLFIECQLRAECLLAHPCRLETPLAFVHEGATCRACGAGGLRWSTAAQLARRKPPQQHKLQTNSRRAHQGAKSASGARGLSNSLTSSSSVPRQGAAGWKFDWIGLIARLWRQRSISASVAKSLRSGVLEKVGLVGRSDPLDGRCDGLRLRIIASKSHCRAVAGIVG